MPDNAFKISKLLLHDNDEDEAYFFNQALKLFQPPIELICTTNFSQLVAKLDTAPDLIFLDINLPEKNGFECLKIIRSKAYLDHTPIIMYSNSNRPKEVREAYEHGANLFISKPTKINNVEDALKAVFAFDWTNIKEITQKHSAESTILRFNR